ncbi:MAG: ECF transporter S component [Candidatus Treponema excrementipullorum]|nr:ECF transporter S component [Spirochaetia bacterium]MDD7012630.1 ECF transporter S component [Candidatus Treponema excrementipullorum]MDY4465558.1 ECF transporter S component [Candidatus Treponema excrementipullorum]MDY4708161.1 ECF transporter S component [Candidatus Treponema excrementipullorum]
MNSALFENTVTKKIAVIGALGALTVLFGLLPIIGYIRLPWGLAITLLHIPTILGALIAGPVAGIGIGIIFGLTSLYQATQSAGGLDILFVNPLISVLPRLLLGATVAYLFMLLVKIRLAKPVAAVVASVLSTLLHTIYVSLALYIFAGSQVSQLMGGAGLGAFILLLLPNAATEAVTAGIICGAVASILFAIHTKKSKLSQEE